MKQYILTISDGNKVVVTHMTDKKTICIELPHAVEQAAMSPSSTLVFVRTRPPPSVNDGPNLFAFDANTGEIVWSKTASKQRGASNIYTKIQVASATNELIAWDWNCYRTIFDSTTGLVKESHFYK